jgi:hypothetical protein
VVLSLNEKIKFIESVFGRGILARNSENFDVRCPIPTCQSRKDKGKLKLAIKTKDFRHHCWVCGYTGRTLAPLIKKYGTKEQFTDYCTRLHPTALKYLNDKKDNVDKPAVRLPDDFQLLATSDSIHPNVKAVRKYLTSRGMSDGDLWYYKFGFSHQARWARRAILPSFDSLGNLNFFVGRLVDDIKEKKRYDQPEVIKTEIIFNEINVDWTQRLVLCEGPFDMVKCGQNVVPILGNTLREDSALFCEIIAHGTPIAIALDATEMPKMQILAKKFAEYDIDVLIVDVAPYKDPGEMSKEQFVEALQKAMPVSWDTSFMNRLGRASRTSMRVM